MSHRYVQPARFLTVVFDKGENLGDYVEVKLEGNQKPVALVVAEAMRYERNVQFAYLETFYYRNVTRKEWSRAHEQYWLVPRGFSIRVKKKRKVIFGVEP